MHRTIASLREKGALIALDDFGTGYASLSHLIDMPVSIIKIDKSFIDRMLAHPRSAIIVEAMIDIGLKLGLRIVAEGITSVEQRRRLVELGCILGQGHLFAKAADCSRVTDMLRSNHAQGVINSLAL
jgi:EAL domain-containing protein (putative c-di-GMP-specific phosphodiesterase class I)